MLSDPTISVIVPVYNMEAYLEEAVRSVLEQSYFDWELLLVDDGSSDRSGELCDRFAQQDERIRAFHTGNRGYGAARNTGIRQALGKWIMFLDSDDTLAPWAMEHLLANAAGTDLVMGLYQTRPRSCMTEEGVWGGRFANVSEMGDMLTRLYEPYFFLSVAGKLYSRRIVGDGFDVGDGSLMSDWTFNLRVLPACEGMGFVPEFVYFYRSWDHESDSHHFHSEWLYVSKTVYEMAVGLFPDNAEVERFMAKRYADRVGQHLVMLSVLRAGRLQKLAMIEVERDDPFYELPAIRRAACGRSYRPIWDAFMARNAEDALQAAERVVKEKREKGARG